MVVSARVGQGPAAAPGPPARHAHRRGGDQGAEPPQPRHEPRRGARAPAGPGGCGSARAASAQGDPSNALLETQTRRIESPSGENQGDAFQGLRMKAVVLLSGGLDSPTVAAIARSQGFEPCAISFRYGQRHVLELESAARVAASLGITRHVTLEFDLRKFGGSALTGDFAVPKGRAPEAMTQGIPITYVPARNTIFLSFALAYAETLGASDIFVGVNALDYSGYPDCHPEYIDAFERLANLATKAGVEGTQRLPIHAPLMPATRDGNIRHEIQLDVHY